MLVILIYGSRLREVLNLNIERVLDILKVKVEETINEALSEFLPFRNISRYKSN